MRRSRHWNVRVAGHGPIPIIVGLDYVCDPFFQVEQGDTRRYPGIGLGLSIVRDVVLAMTGEIGIESELGKGTMVTIKLPRDTQAPLPEVRETAVVAVG